MTIYLSGAAKVSFNGSANINLQAPTSGTYSGILFFGDRTQTGLNKFNGTAASKMTGAIYFASQDVQYNGNFSGLNGCTQVIGSTVEWTGNATMAVDCAGDRRHGGGVIQRLADRYAASGCAHRARCGGRVLYERRPG